VRECRAITWVRDLVNTPAQDMGPAELAAAAESLAAAHNAKLDVVVGDALREQGYRTIHAVGQGSPRAARLIDIRWGEETHPRVTLIGKGVCFDSGGLNLKTADGMRLMKKDMAGAAHVLALADLIMDARLPVRLRVLIPAVDNAIGGAAIRPGDIVRTRSGDTVEIGNTDAEGRLILCDALAAASSEHPDLLIDMATLTGAARVALGPELPALFCNDDEIAAALAAAARATDDPLWRLPLWQPYRKDLASNVADLNNVSHNPFAGAIYAALFLQAFVGRGIPWIHLDLYGWNLQDRPGRPAGGEAQTLRATFRFLRQRYGHAAIAD
jgi:leucyl aminopeptidase